MLSRLVRQRGVLHLIAVIPLSLFLFDAKLWGAIAGAALLVSTVALTRSWWLRLVGLIGAAWIAYLAGYRIEFITHPDGGFFYLKSWSWLITLGWIIVVSQGVTVLGQLDASGRLLTKILIISGGALMLIALWQGQLLGVLLFGAVLVIGVRRHGAPLEQWGHVVGYGVAVATIAGLVKTTASLTLLAPLIALVLPFTSTLSIAYSHRLTWVHEFKLGRAPALVWLYLVSAYASVLAFAATRLEGEAFITVIGVAGVSLGLLVWGCLRLSPMASTASRFVLLGTPIDCVTLDEAVQKLASFLSARASAVVCTPDTTALMRAQQDRKLREIYKQADLVTPDGTGIVWAGRLLGVPLRERVSGIDLLERFFASWAHRRAPLRVFLLGAAPGVADQAAQKLRERYPKLQIVGTHHGYFQPREDEQILSLINRSQPDILLVGLGVPKQELWIYENRAKLNVSVLMGVGGCFDVWAGRLSRAPKGWQRLGLEWLYRVFQEPRRLVRVSAIPVFVGQISLIKIARLLCD